jgi:hypothetical protein
LSPAYAGLRRGTANIRIEIKTTASKAVVLNLKIFFALNQPFLDFSGDFTNTAICLD